MSSALLLQRRLLFHLSQIRTFQRGASGIDFSDRWTASFSSTGFFLNGSSWAQVNQVQTQWLCSSLRACTYVHRWCLFQTRWVRTGTLWQRCPAARSRRCRWSHKWHRSCLRHYRTSCTRCRRHAEGCSGALHRERHVRHVRQQGEINRRWG